MGDEDAVIDWGSLTRHSRASTPSGGSPLKAVAAGVLLGLAGVPLAAAGAVDQLAAAAGPPTSLELSSGSATLDHRRAQDAPAAARLGGRWAAQLASARIAQDPASVAFEAASYLDTHQQISTFRDVVLVRGDDITGKASDVPTWLTLNNRRFGSARAVGVWCRQQSLSRATCLQRTVKRSDEDQPQSLDHVS